MFDPGLWVCSVKQKEYKQVGSDPVLSQAL